MFIDNGDPDKRELANCVRAIAEAMLHEAAE